MKMSQISKKTGLVKCRECGEEKSRHRSGLDTQGCFIYRELNGKRWNRMQCNSCACVSKTKRSRQLGTHGPRSESTEPRVKKAYSSELVVSNFFKKLGFKVTHTTSHGPDLIISSGLETFTCEVKLAGICNHSWIVESVTEKRKQDDLMAIVLPDNTVYLEPMKTHLSLCTPSGKRTVTRLVRDRCKSLATIKKFKNNGATV